MNGKPGMEQPEVRNAKQIGIFKKMIITEKREYVYIYIYIYIIYRLYIYIYNIYVYIYVFLFCQIVLTAIFVNFCCLNRWLQI